jgi:hypothetical protein
MRNETLIHAPYPSPVLAGFLGMIIHHTDAEREFAYDRESHIGKLDKGLDAAALKGWTMVSLKDDWKTIFPSNSK